MQIARKILFAFAAVMLWAAPASAQQRLALVIGNGAYSKGALANPPNDANLTAAALSDAGFEVTKVLNASQNSMKQQIRAFAIRLQRAGPNAVAAFYYAGHGVQVDGRNYLIPVDATITAKPDLEYETIEAQWVLDMIGDSGSAMSIIILDACRDNPFRSFTRSNSRGLARMDAPRGALLSYSTAPGDVAADGIGANSPFTEALASAIRTPGLKIEETFKQVRRNVLAATGDRQLPWESTSLTGDFYFTPGGQSQPVAPTQPVSVAPPPTPAPAAPATPEPSASAAAPVAANRSFIPEEVSLDTYYEDDMLRCYHPEHHKVYSHFPNPSNRCRGGSYMITEGDFHEFLKHNW